MIGNISRDQENVEKPKERYHRHKSSDAATSLTTWSLAEFNGSLGELTFNVYDADSNVLGSNLALEDTITTGTFTNYGFSIDDETNTLKFASLA